MIALAVLAATSPVHAGPDASHRAYAAHGRDRQDLQVGGAACRGASGGPHGRRSGRPTNSWTILSSSPCSWRSPPSPKRRLDTTSRHRDPHEDAPKGVLSFTWPRSLASVSQIAIQRFDIIVIAATLGQPKRPSTAATRFVVVGQFGVQAIQQVLQPRMSAMLAKNQLGPLERVFQTSTAWNVAVAWPLYVTVACAAGVYLRLFGQGYTSSEAVAVVVTMSVAMMLAVAAGPLDTLLLMAGHSKASTINALVALAVNVALCLTLIPSMGIPGAGVAWAAAVVVRNVLTYVQVRKALGITPFSSSVGIAVALPVLAFAVPQLVSSVVRPHCRRLRRGFRNRSGVVRRRVVGGP